MEQEAREREKEKERSNLLTGITSNSNAGNADGANGGRVQTLDTMHALCLPLGASISLLVMFFFFDSMQMLLAICTASKFSVANFQFRIGSIVRTVITAQIEYEIPAILLFVCSYSHSCIGISSIAHVSVHH